MKNIFLISILLFSCKIPEKYNVVGVIKDIDIDNNRLLIDHDEIPGFMVKMVMYFNLDEKNDINQFTINCTTKAGRRPAEGWPEAGRRPAEGRPRAGRPHAGRMPAT